LTTKTVSINFDFLQSIVLRILTPYPYPIVVPHISQSYVVPAPNSYSYVSSINDRAVFSMWEHFLDFCKADAMSIVTIPRKVPALNAYALINPYTGRKRLSAFVKLSQSKNM
jgi:hypothetical protein